MMMLLKDYSWGDLTIHTIHPSTSLAYYLDDIANAIIEFRKPQLQNLLYWTGVFAEKNSINFSPLIWWMFFGVDDYNKPTNEQTNKQQLFMNIDFESLQ